MQKRAAVIQGTIYRAGRCTEEFQCFCTYSDEQRVTVIQAKLESGRYWSAAIVGLWDQLNMLAYSSFPPQPPPLLYGESGRYSQLSPCRHLTIMDKIQIHIYRGLTENDSRYYRLSLFRRQNNVPKVSAVTRVDCIWLGKYLNWSSQCESAWWWLLLSGLPWLCCGYIILSLV